MLEWEIQSVKQFLPLLKSDLAKIILSCCNQELGAENIEWLEKKSLCIVLCSNGYPGDYKKNVIINNVKNLRVQGGSIYYSCWY